MNPLALTEREQDEIVAVLLLTGIITRDDVYRAANKRLRAAFEASHQTLRDYINS